MLPKGVLHVHKKCEPWAQKLGMTPRALSSPPSCQFEPTPATHCDFADSRLPTARTSQVFPHSVDAPDVVARSSVDIVLAYE